MLTVGLTGNIASGKSTVVGIWRELGAVVSDADRLARRAVEPGTDALARITARWGAGVLTPEGELDRAALRDVVFRDPTERAALESIVHPAVAALREEEIRRAREAGAAIHVSDIPLLFEAGLQGGFDVTVLVDAPEALRRERLVRDRGLDPAEADRMIAAQLPSSEKRGRADLVIENDGSLDGLRAAATRAWRELERRAAGEAS